MDRFQSKNHNIGTYRIIEISLPCYNDKQYILKVEYSRLSYFHKSTRQSCKNNYYFKSFNLIKFSYYSFIIH